MKKHKTVKAKGVNHKVPLTIKVPKELKEAIEQYAAERHWTASASVNMWLHGIFQKQAENQEYLDSLVEQLPPDSEKNKFRSW